MEAEGSGLALEADLALAVDQVQAVGPAGVGALGGVPGIVQKRGELDLQVADAGGGYVRTLVLVFGVGEEHLLAQIDGQLPAVSGVRLLDIDDEKIDLVAVLAVELIEGGNLPPEGWSSVATEDQYHGLARQTIRKPDAVVAVVGFEMEVRGWGADLEGAGASDGPKPFEGDGHHDGHRQSGDDAGELFGRLAHDDEKSHSVDGVKGQKDGGPFEKSQIELLIKDFPKIKEKNPYLKPLI